MSTTPPAMPFLLRDLSPSTIGAGMLAALVGYGGTVAIVIHGLAAVGATQAQIVSGLFGLGLAMAFPAIVLSLRTREPVAIAWSTPGMVLLIGLGTTGGGTSAGGSYEAAMGAFVTAGLLIAIAGLWAPLGRLVAAIPRPIASAMLAGILLNLCLGPFQAVRDQPAVTLLVIATWLVVGRFARLWAAPAALVVALVALWLTSGGGTPIGPLLPHVDWVRPVFTWQSTVSIAVPLFVVTMASQNIPGLAVLATYGYRPRVSPIFIWTGVMSALSALVGAPTINLAAITAAICAGPDAHPDPARRYPSAIAAGVVYAVLGCGAALAAAVVTGSSPVLIEAVAGLAVIGALGSSLLTAVESETDRVPALITFLVTASGLTAFSVGAAFWGLLAGVGVHLLYRRRPSRSAG